MDGEFVNLTPEDIGSEHLCCVIRLKTAHPGVEAKRAARRTVRPCGHARKAPAEGSQRKPFLNGIRKARF